MEVHQSDDHGKEEGMTSKGLIKRLQSWTAKHPIAVYEKMAFLNLYCDADYVAVTLSGQVYEYEIKVSRGDYLRDKNKRRHKIYTDQIPGKKPNRFWYVTPPGVVNSDLPTYAGHILVYDEFGMREEVKAPLIWRGKHDVKTILQVAGAMRHRGDGRERREQ